MHLQILSIYNEQIKELLKNNIPIVDIRRSSEWDQTGVVPKSILLTFFDKEGKIGRASCRERV